MHDRIIRKAEASTLSGLSERTIDRREAAGDFPARLKLSPGTVGWRLHEILEWVATRPTATTSKDSRRKSTR